MRAPTRAKPDCPGGWCWPQSWPWPLRQPRDSVFVDLNWFSIHDISTPRLLANCSPNPPVGGENWFFNRQGLICLVNICCFWGSSNHRAGIWSRRWHSEASSFPLHTLPSCSSSATWSPFLRPCGMATSIGHWKSHWFTTWVPVLTLSPNNWWPWGNFVNSLCLSIPL